MVFLGLVVLVLSDRFVCLPMKNLLYVRCVYNRDKLDKSRSHDSNQVQYELDINKHDHNRFIMHASNLESMIALTFRNMFRGSHAFIRLGTELNNRTSCIRSLYPCLVSF
jgi:hypothetical protein